MLERRVLALRASHLLLGAACAAQVQATSCPAKVYADLQLARAV